MTITKRNAEQRAEILGRKIEDLVEKGEFVIGGGFMRWFGGACTGCALGAAAYACGRRPETCYPLNLSGSVREELSRAVEEEALASEEECFQLEMGYEHFTMVEGVYPDRESPFYQLGERLRDFRISL